MVKDATLRARLLTHRAADAEFTVARGHRPRLWADADGQAIEAAIEASWEAKRAERWLQLRGLRCNQQQQACAGSEHPAGGAEGTPARMHPLQRAVAAGRAVAGPGLDEHDVLLVGVLGPLARAGRGCAIVARCLRCPRG